MSSAAKTLPTEEEILARFHRMRITIGLSASAFGYASIGSPGIINRLTTGHKLHAKNKERLAYVLDELEKGHSIPARGATVNKTRTKLDEDKNPSVGIKAATTASRSDMED
jgi:hypothetical protein